MLTFDELQDHLVYKNEAVAYNKMAELSEYHSRLIDQFDQTSFEIAVWQQHVLRLQQPRLMLQRDLKKLSFKGIERRAK